MQHNSLTLKVSDVSEMNIISKNGVQKCKYKPLCELESDNSYIFQYDTEHLASCRINDITGQHPTVYDNIELYSWEDLEAIRINDHQICSMAMAGQSLYHRIVDIKTRKKIRIMPIFTLHEVCERIWFMRSEVSESKKHIESAGIIWLIDEYLPTRGTFVEGDHEEFEPKDIGVCLAKLFEYWGGNGNILRVYENPFKTKERDRLANWLYEIIHRILPLGITGIITEYCTHVRINHNEVLVNHTGN